MMGILKDLGYAETHVNFVYVNSKSLCSFKKGHFFITIDKVIFFQKLFENVDGTWTHFYCSKSSMSN